MFKKINLIPGFILIFFIAVGCQISKSKMLVTRSYKSNALSGEMMRFSFDSSVLSSFYKTYPVSDSIKKEVNEFYRRRYNHTAWFKQGNLIQAVPAFYNQLLNYTLDFEDSSLNNVHLDSLIKFIQTDEQKFYSQTSNYQQLELLLTTSYFAYAKKVYGGFIKNPSNHDWFIPRKVRNYQILLDSLVSDNNNGKTIEPLNEYYFRLSKKLRIYRNIQKNGGFPVIVPIRQLKNGELDSTLLLVKQYLFLSGDLKENEHTLLFTDALTTAIKNFQKRMGISENGVLDINTLAQLNISVEVRIKQMLVNMERLRWMPEEMESNYLLINIPDFKLNIVENNKKIWSMDVVVGKVVTQTNIFKGSLSRIILNPYWVIPTSIVQNEIVPQIISDTSYLIKNNMEVLLGNKIVNPAAINWEDYIVNSPYTIRQKPGITNALGKIKFLFPNSYSIYLHDTPVKGVFAESKRDFSHGCIRVAEPKKLALYLLRNNTAWSFKKLENTLETDIETGIRVSPSIPVYIVYFTSWVDNSEQLNFRNDLYNLDKKILIEFFGEQPR